MKASSIFLFLGGVAVGAIAGMLIAPEQGLKLRKKIKEMLDEKSIQLTGVQLEEFIEKVKNKIKSGINNIEDAVNEIIKEEKCA